MDDQQLRDLLVRAAELPSGPVGAPVDLARRVRRRRVRVRSLSLVGVAIVVAVATAVPTIALQSGASRRAPVTPAESVAPAPPVSTAGTAAALAADEWSQLPPAPIAGRAPAAAVWDGAQMLVWGGAMGTTFFADGAAYDPVSHVWTTLPPSPLSARSDSAYVWTGRSLFIWGGLDSNAGSGHYTNDGAVYNPGTRTWRLLPPAPLPASGDPQALLVDGQVVVLSGPAPSGNGYSGMAAYDPTHNTWRRLAPVPPPPRGAVFSVAVTSTGSSIVALEAWYDSAVVDYEESYGLAIYRYDTATNHWSVLNTHGNGPGFGVGQALWTGRELIVPSVSGCPPFASCPPTPYVSGAVLDIATSRWSRMPPVELGGGSMTSIWTGAALLELNTGAVFSGVVPGAGVVWDPDSDEWTTLPTAPYAGNDTAAVWTGSRLLVWGPMSRSSDFDGTHPPPVSTVGLELGAVPTAVGPPGMFTPSPPAGAH